MFSLPARAFIPWLQTDLKTFSTVCEAVIVLHAVFTVLTILPLSDEQKNMGDGLFLTYLLACGLRVAIHAWENRRKSLSE